jgi:hypothetical protein
MPAESCIKHSGGFFKFNDDFHRLLGYDSCATVVLGIFEFWTNGELSRMERLGDSGDPWIDASVAAICQEARHQYSDRPVREALAKLEKRGFLQTRATKLGAIKRYLLKYSVLQNALNGNLGNFTVENTEGSGNFTVENTEVRDCYKEEEVRTEETRNTSSPGKVLKNQNAVSATPPPPSSAAPLPPSERLNSDVSNVTYEEFKKRWNWFPKRPWPKISNSKATTDALSKKWEAVQIDQDTLDEELESWMEDEWAIEHDYGPGGLISRLMKRSGVQRKDKRRHSPTPAQYVGQSRVCEQMWRALVPSDAVDWSSYPVPSWPHSQDFYSNFEKICLKAQAIRTANLREHSWLQYSWLFKCNGDDNWRKLLRGEYDWMANKGKPVQEDRSDVPEHLEI